MKKLLTLSLCLFCTLTVNAQKKQLTEMLRKLDSVKHLSGVLLVVQEEEVIFEAAFGSADRSEQIANEVDTKFMLGSLTKQFTAVLIMQAVENKILALDSPITSYLPNFRKKTGQEITIRHLLTHTHGIPNAN